MKLAILGGSFNPVHIGHLFLADAVLTSGASLTSDASLTGLDYDRVILVPAFQSPFKIDAEGASPRDRMSMLAASIAGDPRMTIDDCEINRQGVSYTIDTLKDIIARYKPEGKPGLILGDDLASTFHKWRNPEEIAELADIIIARRLLEPGTYAHVDRSVFFPYPHRTLDNEIINVSSQLVREKISRGDAWRYLVPSGARHIIEDRFLYGFTGNAGRENTYGLTSESRLLETIVRLENEVRTVLDANRFTHSRNTALLSWDLCRRFGLDPQKGYLAGIAHDMCKGLEVEKLIRLANADGGGIQKLEKKKPGLLHARAAAVLLQRKYDIRDRDILEAIRYHTTGKADMGPLAKVVYVADKIEVSRTGVDPVLRKMSRTADLDTLFAAVLDNTVAFLKSHQLDISYGTRRLLAAMQKRNDHEKN